MLLKWRQMILNNQHTQPTERPKCLAITQKITEEIGLSFFYLELRELHLFLKQSEPFLREQI